MTRIEAMTAFSSLDTPALYEEMQRRGIASPDFDAACKWAEKVCDRIARHIINILSCHLFISMSKIIPDTLQ